MKKGMLVALVAASTVLFGQIAMAQGAAATPKKGTTTTAAKMNDNGGAKMTKKHKAHKKGHKHVKKAAATTPAK